MPLARSIRDRYSVTDMTVCILFLPYLITPRSFQLTSTPVWNSRVVDVANRCYRLSPGMAVGRSPMVHAPP